MKQYLKYYVNKNNSLDYHPCIEGEEIVNPENFVKWITKEDNIKIIPPDMKELLRKSVKYWRERYNSAGLPSPDDHLEYYK